MANSVSSCRVAVIGGGISGLVCAARLGQLGFVDVTVFDTGRHAVGGRCSSRSEVIDGKLHIFDHACQYFTVTDPVFANIARFLVKKGRVKEWTGKIGTLQRGKFQSTTETCFIGADGMRSIAEGLADLINVRRLTWIKNCKWDSNSKKWQVDNHGYFDYLIIAHNGKCADTLMNRSGAARVHRLLRVRFGSEFIRHDSRMQLSSLWVLLVAFKSPLSLKYEGAHVIDDEDLSWLANNSAKLSRTHGNLECWTLISTRRFGSQHKVPQEAIPPKKAAVIQELLLAAFCRVTGVDAKKLNPAFTKVQLWGAALPMNVIDSKEGCIWDAECNVGVCGDWLVSPSLQGAALSGMAVAEAMHTHVKGIRTSINLNPTFKMADGQAVGHFQTSRGVIWNREKQDFVKQQTKLN